MESAPNLFECTTPSGNIVTFYLPTPQHWANIRTLQAQSPTTFSLDEMLLGSCITDIDGKDYPKGYALVDILAPLNGLPTCKDLNTLVEVFKAKGVYPTQQELLMSAQSCRPVQFPDPPLTEPDGAAPLTDLTA